VINRVARSLTEALRAFGAVFANPDLRRLQLAYATSSIGQWAGSVAVGVYAFEVGGATLVGVAMVARMVPSALAAPFASALGDRHPRDRVMVVSDVIRAAAAGGSALALALSAPAALVFGLSAVVGVVSTAFEPAKAALLPSLARRPEELAAANVASSTTDGLSLFVGPALGGLLLAASDFQYVVAATAVSFVVSALLIARIDAVAGADEAAEEDDGEEVPFLRAVAQGVAAVRESAAARLLVALITAQVLVDGALGVLLISLALDLLEIGEAGLGFLNSAVGVGGLLGALAALLLTRGKRLGAPFTLGLVLWGLPIVAVGLFPNQWAALLLLMVLGVGNTLVDVAGFTFLQRAVPDAVLARVFGILESLMVAAVALGAVIAPALIAVLGVRGACVVVGLFLPALALLSAPALARFDRAAVVPARELELLRGVPLFAPLAPEMLEALTARLEPLRFAAGEAIVEQGERGDRFYVIDEGEVEVAVDGRVVERERGGDHFGEIALLRDSPRTATVRAIGEVHVLALERGDFIAAVTGHSTSAERADAVIGARLARARPAVAAL